MRSIAFATVFAFYLNGCASIVGEKHQIIPISSQPLGAELIVKDETGTPVFKGQTPASLTLLKSDGSYFGGKDYTAEFTKTGFEPQKMEIVSGLNGWYLAGNLFFGGLIGWLIVDPWSGSMYNLSPDKVNPQLGGIAYSEESEVDPEPVAKLMGPEKLQPQIRAATISPRPEVKTVSHKPEFKKARSRISVDKRECRHQAELHESLPFRAAYIICMKSRGWVQKK